MDRMVDLVSTLVVFQIQQQHYHLEMVDLMLTTLYLISYVMIIKLAD